MTLKKVGSTGRFGVRYGRKIRQNVLKVEKLQKIRQKCPYCRKTCVKRLASGIWYCEKCDSKFAGRAYTPK